MMRKRTVTCLIFLFLLGFASPLWAQSGASVQYVYDALGRLTTVIDPSGNVATYNYDAVGNLQSITRSTTSPSALAILGFSPAQGSVGQTVAIQGQNFSATPSANTVKFNGTAATVTAATANSLTLTVPAGATTGLISVTVGTATANSSNNFTVLAIPVITSVSPTLTVNTPTISSFQVTGSNLTGVTFSFVPAFVPPAIAPSNVVINSNGTSATMTLALASNAAGTFTVVATNATGSSPAIPSASNTLTILSSDPNADADGDGLTNIYEAAIGTNYANSSTTGNGLPDGWAVFYGLNPLNAAAAGQTAPNTLTYLQCFQRGLNPLIPNLVPPAVSNVFPVNGATNYPTNGVIVVRFTEPLLAGVDLPAAQKAINAGLPAQSGFSAANALAAAQVLQAYLQRTCCGTTAVPGVVKVLQNGSTVAGFLTLSNDRLSITFAPTRPLSASTTYTVSVQGARDAAGNLMTGTFQSSFRTGLGPLRATPGALFTNPLDGATGVDTNAPFRIMFSTPVNPATLTPQTFFVFDANPPYTQVAGTLQVDPFGLTASFVPSQPYAVGRQYIARITSGLQSFTGSSYQINANNQIAFTTGFGTDNQSFNLIGTSPANGLTGVPLNALVVLQFEEPVDATSALIGLQVQLAGVPIAGAIALSDGNKRITFTPASPLTANSTYLVVTTTQLTDFAGNPLANPDSSTFSTGSTTDTTPPSVVNVSPANSASGVPTNAVIQVQFSKRINPLTVTTSTFCLYLQNFGQYTCLPGTIITVSPDGLTATFKPSPPLAPSTYFGISLPTGITDMEGQPLSSSFSGSSFTTDFGPATTAPTVVMVSPPNGASGVQANGRVNVVLSAPLSVASIGSSSVTLSAGGTGVPGTVSLSTDRTTLTFVPTSLLAVSATYTVNVSGVTDRAGNAVVPFTSSFTTGTSGVADTSAPAVVSVNPPSGATGVAVNSSIVLTFNKNIDPSTVNGNTVPVALSGSFSPLVAGSYAVSGAVVTFTPSAPMPSNALVFVAVYTVVKDLAGNSPTNNFSSSFTTVTATNTTPPTVVMVTPANGATGIGLNASVVLKFSQSLNGYTINANRFALFANGKNLYVSPGGSADNQVVTLNAGILPASSTVTVVATSGVLDLYGNALAYFSSQFTTAAAFDTTHPSVLSQRPGIGGTGVALNTSVVLYVSEAMNAATIPGALHISQNGVPVNGTVQVTDNGQTIQFTPSVPFQNNAQVQVFLDTTAQDVDGSNLTAYQGSFTTAINTSTVAPSAVGTNPVNGATAVPTNVVIDVGFNELLNPGTVNNSTVYLTQGSSGPTVASTVSLLPSGWVIQIVPNAPLTANTQYFYHLTSGLLGTNGLAFSSSNWFFTTGAGADTVAPTIQTLSPPNGSVNVGNNAIVRVLFSKPVNPMTVSGSSIQLTGGGTTQVPDVITFGNNNMNVLLIPHGPLPDNTVMTLAISGVTDVAGNQVTAQTTHFTTGTGPDLTIPVVWSTNPYNTESSVPLNAPIQVQMNEPVDPGTVNSSAVAVIDRTTSQQTMGNYSLSANGQTISFVPSAPLTASRIYDVIFGYVNVAIADLAGNLLVSVGGPPNFSFTTGTTSNTTQPQVTGVSPANGLTGVPTNARVMIQFNEPVNGLTVNQVTVSGGGTVNVTRTLSNGNQTLALVPVVPLNSNTSYTVTIAGVQDISGNSLAAPVTTSFTTGTGADLWPPTVVSFNPPSLATGVLRNTAIQVQFSKRINPFTVTTSTFWVSPSSTGTPVPGTIVISPDGLTATLTPSAPLAPSTNYTIQALTGITDLAGQTWSSGFSASFTTGTQ